MTKKVTDINDGAYDGTIFQTTRVLYELIL